MYDFKWNDPISWIAIGIPAVIIISAVIAVWKVLKWLIQMIL